MEPKRITSLDGLLTPALTKGIPATPAAKAQPALKIKDFGQPIGADEVLSWVGKQAGVDPSAIRQTNGNKINLSLDPNTRRIKIEAPKYYIDSPEFKEQVLPAFKQLEGKELTDTQFKSLVNSDMVKDMQRQSDDVLKRFEAIQTYKKEFPKASDDDALLYLRNVAAANASNNDSQTQLVVGVNSDGSQRTQSVKQVLQNLNSYSDKQKNDMVAATHKQLDDPNISEQQKAINLSLLQFASKKEVLEASGSQKIQRFVDKFFADYGSSPGGRILSAPADIALLLEGKGRSAANIAEQNINEIQNLEGLETPEMLGSIAGKSAGLVTDIAASIPLAGAATAATAGVISKLPGGVKAVEGIANSLSKLDDVGKIGNVTANTIRGVPQELTFGATQAVASGEYTPKDFAINTALNAAGLSAARLAGRTINALDTTTNKALSEASANVGRAVVRGYDAVRNLPGIRKMVNVASKDFIDQASALRRQLRSDWANKKITTSELHEGYNYIRFNQMRGRTEANQALVSQPVFQEGFALRQRLAKEKKLEPIARYANARQQLQRIEGGRYDMSDKRRAEYVELLKKEVETNQSPEAEQYYETLAKINSQVTDWSTMLGLTDDTIIEALRTDDAFKGGYIHLQKNLEPVDDMFRQTASDKSLTNSQVMRKMTGPAKLEDLQDPYDAAIEKLYAIFELNARNRLNQVAVQGIRDGNIAGTITHDAEIIRARNALRNEFKEERDIVTDLIGAQVAKLEGDLNRLADDVEDFAGTGQTIIAQHIDDAVDEMVEAIAKDKRLGAEVTRLMDELGGGKEGSEVVAALGVLDRNKRFIIERLETSLLKTELGAEQRRGVVRMVEDSITSRMDEELAARMTSRSPLRAKLKEIRELNNEIVPASKGVKPQAYYESGAKGYYELADPELQAYYNSNKSVAEEGMFQNLLMAVSRIYRAGTTGANPVFALAVNPARDVVQSAVLGGTNVLNPEVSITALLRGMNVPEGEIQRLGRELNAFIESSSSLTSSTFRPDRPKLEMAENVLQRQSRGKVKDAVINLNPKDPEKALSQIEDALSGPEILVRKRNYQARFDAAIKRGLDVDQAHQEGLFYAANTTTDFLNVGERLQRIARTIPYLTAAINGQASFLRLVMLDPVGVSARLAAGIVAPTIYMTLRNLSDPERAEIYATIPDWEKENNFIAVLDDGTILKIPMALELAKVVNPIKERIEALHGIDNETFMRTAAKLLLGAGPVDLSGFANEDFQGNTDTKTALNRAASTLLPQAFRSPVELFSKQDVYLGNALSPTDAELYARGQVDEGQPITAADRTTASADSFLLRKLSNLTGQDQSVFQNIVKNFTGSVGQFVLNGLDRLVGGAEAPHGGKSMAETMANRFFGVSYNQAEQDFYKGLGQLEAEKEIVEQRIQGLSSDAYYGNENAIAGRGKVLEEFGAKVASFTNSYGAFYQAVGGLEPHQLDRVIGLLDFGPEQGAFDTGTHQSNMLQDVRNESAADAKRRATDLGLPTSNDRDRYGRLLSDVAGELYGDNSRTSLVNSNINQRIYGAPKQLAYEFSQIIKADKKNGVRSLYDAQQGYYQRIDALYAKAQGLKGKEAQDIYSEISDIQEEYMTKEFDPRIRSLIEKYGPEVLMNNKEIFDEIGSRIMVPGDFTPFTSRKKQPYQKDDVEAYLRDRYGVGYINERNLPSDQQAMQIIDRVNKDLSAGRTSSAQFKLNDLQDDINSGKVYVDPDAMNTIKDLIAIANKR